MKIPYLILIATLIMVGIIDSRQNYNTHHDTADVCEQSDCKPLPSQVEGKNRSFEYD